MSSHKVPNAGRTRPTILNATSPIRLVAEALNGGSAIHAWVAAAPRTPQWSIGHVARALESMLATAEIELRVEGWNDRRIAGTVQLGNCHECFGYGRDREPVT